MEADKARIQEKKEKSTKTAKTNLAEVIGAGSSICQVPKLNGQ
jgi:hypothetical protein